MNKSISTRFEGFGYEATELSAYVFSIDTFVISLKNGRIIRHVAEQHEAFRQWLEAHGIRNVNETLGKMVYNHYFPAKGKGKKEQ